MGCDIHSICQIERDGKWETVGDIFPATWREGYNHQPFDHRDYGLFGFLANVRNYSQVPSLALPRGLPKDIELEYCYLKEYLGDHSHSWFLLSELMEVDYNRTFVDKRYDDQLISLREFIGATYFRDLRIMTKLSDDWTKVRVVFGFDS